MSARWLALSLILSAGISGPVAAQVTSGASPAWPPVPGAAPAEGEKLFAETCARCHRTGGMGTGILSRRKGIAGEGLLEKRDDLTISFVETVVRVGTGNMPRISRAEVSNRQLAKIADYLARGKP
jgi:mono/diheme cytochrome c family protein